jgi:hypothetical protein
MFSAVHARFNLGVTVRTKQHTFCSLSSHSRESERQTSCSNSKTLTAPIGMVELHGLETTVVTATATPATEFTDKDFLNLSAPTTHGLNLALPATPPSRVGPARTYAHAVFRAFDSHATLSGMLRTHQTAEPKVGTRNRKEQTTAGVIFRPRHYLPHHSRPRRTRVIKHDARRFASSATPQRTPKSNIESARCR